MAAHAGVSGTRRARRRQLLKALVFQAETKPEAFSFLCVRFFACTHCPAPRSNTTLRHRAQDAVFNHRAETPRSNTAFARRVHTPRSRRRAQVLVVLALPHCAQNNSSSSSLPFSSRSSPPPPPPPRLCSLALSLSLSLPPFARSLSRARSLSLSYWHGSAGSHAAWTRTQLLHAACT